ncbi:MULTISPECIES: GNAT family N-acetyltransferase [Clostridium]|uniref:GNAT family N-acetyltransferase n=1 Tax=Clostridium cibarium TaxID=2762247 RepID=A0ABR8PYK5_9CLOT|nr:MULTISPECIES: GNAT family N-acetyltransferase [Clostridium]MBD7913255.1 GNAT family N-acetyltransferase [Clostridium cibarium]
MYELLKETEIEYVRCFSKEEKEGFVTKFSDESFQDSYANNLTILNKTVDDKIKVEIINNEIYKSKKEKRDFLLFEVDGEISKEVIKKLNISPTSIDKLDYMKIETAEYIKINQRGDCVVKEVKTDEEYSDIIKINILDYAPLVGRSYSRRRIKRKVDVYKESSNNLSCFISYLEDEPVGSCELLWNKDVAKIEDFGVLKEYQNQGVGKSILRNMLKKSYDDGVKTAYVITENKGRAKEMYKKLGFKKIGEKTQLIFSL